MDDFDDDGLDDLDFGEDDWGVSLTKNATGEAVIQIQPKPAVSIEQRRLKTASPTAGPIWVASPRQAPPTKQAQHSEAESHSYSEEDFDLGEHVSSKRARTPKTASPFNPPTTDGSEDWASPRNGCPATFRGSYLTEKPPASNGGHRSAAKLPLVTRPPSQTMTKTETTSASGARSAEEDNSSEEDYGDDYEDDHEDDHENDHKDDHDDDHDNYQEDPDTKIETKRSYRSRSAPALVSLVNRIVEKEKRRNTHTFFALNQEYQSALAHRAELSGIMPKWEFFEHDLPDVKLLNGNTRKKNNNNNKNKSNNHHDNTHPHSCYDVPYLGQRPRFGSDVEYRLSFVSGRFYLHAAFD